jgi:hypothetical protein
MAPISLVSEYNNTVFSKCSTDFNRWEIQKSPQLQQNRRTLNVDYALKIRPISLSCKALPHTTATSAEDLMNSNKLRTDQSNAGIPMAIPMAAAALDATRTEINETMGIAAAVGKKKVCLFYCSETEDLARRIAAESDAVELRSITWRYLFNLYITFISSFYLYFE